MACHVSSSNCTRFPASFENPDHEEIAPTALRLLSTTARSNIRCEMPLQRICDLTSETRPKFRTSALARAERGTKAVGGAFIRKLHLGLIMPLDASAVGELLHEFAQRTAVRGGNPYRARGTVDLLVSHEGTYLEH
jgi:hypothetical protein